MTPLVKLRLFWLHTVAGRPASLRFFHPFETGQPPRWPVSSVASKKLLKRRFQFAGCDVEMAGRILWQAEASDDWHRELYAFRWLQDIISVQNSKIASSFAREFINGFIVEPEGMGPEAWEPEVAGERLSNWLYHADAVLRGGSPRFRKRFMRSVVRHAWKLHRNLAIVTGDPLLNTVKGLISLSVFAPGLRLDPRGYEPSLHLAIDDVVLEDGFHASRIPEQHLRTLESLIEIRHLLALAHTSSERLEEAIEKMGIGLRFLLHGDGRLALFNGSLMGDEMMIAHAVGQSDNAEEPPAHLPVSGFFRLEKGPVRLLISGRVGDDSPSDSSFEFSEGGERFVVNCGGYRGLSESWDLASLASAAHSTLSLDSGGDRHDLAASMRSLLDIGEAHPPLPEDALNQDAAGHVMRTVRMVRAGGSSGVHDREIRLSQNSYQFSGTDSFRLIGTTEEDLPGLRLCLRFHLHPDIRCQKQKDGSIGLSSVGGNHWLFTSTLPKSTRLEESVYLGYHGKPQKTLQIAVCTDVTTRNTEFHWVFVRQNEYE